MKLPKELYNLVTAHHEAPIIHPSKRHLGIILTMASYVFFAIYTVFFQLEIPQNKELDPFFSQERFQNPDSLLAQVYDSTIKLSTNFILNSLVDFCYFEICFANETNALKLNWDKTKP